MRADQGGLLIKNVLIVGAAPQEKRLCQDAEASGGKPARPTFTILILLYLHHDLSNPTIEEASCASITKMNLARTNL